MARYAKQWDNFSCGPIAIMNALKWSGRACTVKNDYRNLRNKCKCAPPRGTYRRDFERALRETANEKFTVKKCLSPKITELIDQISSGNAVLLNFLWAGKGRGHYILLVDFNKKTSRFRSVNLGKKTLSWANIRSLRKDMKTRKLGAVYPAAWSLSIRR